MDGRPRGVAQAEAFLTCPSNVRQNGDAGLRAFAMAGSGWFQVSHCVIPALLDTTASMLSRSLARLIGFTR